MGSRKRGIRLKQVNEDQEGYRALAGFFAREPVPRDTRAAERDPPVRLVSAVPQEPPMSARSRLARLLRRDLEEALRLLTEALSPSGVDRRD